VSTPESKMFKLVEVKLEQEFSVGIGLR